mmetsp:Transcript_36658/g.74421  ORF Transcript_36658/g.74421 Transcript_36658/m.74421 type:complete len:465 (+) Transcript_36658:59-1453(+)
MSELEDRLASRIAALEAVEHDRDDRILALEKVLEDAGLSDVPPKETWSVSQQNKESSSLVSVAVTCAETGAAFSFDGSKIHGTMFSPWLQLERWQHLVSTVKLRSSDIVVATYPKSGTTLAEQAVIAFLSGARDASCFNVRDKNALGRRLHGGADTSANNTHSHKTLGAEAPTKTYAKVWPEACMGWKPGEDSGERQRGAEFVPVSWETFDALAPPRLIKTHAPANLVPGDSLLRLVDSSTFATDRLGLEPSADGSRSEARFVVVARTPKDVCTSCFYHAWNPCAQGWPFAAWAHAWSSGLVPSGSWAGWHRGWRERASTLGAERVLMLTYEELTSVDDSVRLGALAKLGVFVLQGESIGSGGGGGGRVEGSGGVGGEGEKAEEEEFEALVKRVDALCNFEAMKKLSTAASSADDGSGSGDSSVSHASHLRHGRSGNWKAHFDAELARTTVDAVCAEEAKEWGL